MNKNIAVELVNLKNYYYLNGIKGIVKDFLENENKYIVKLSEDKLVKVKAINLILLNDIKKLEYVKETNIFKKNYTFSIGSSNKSKRKIYNASNWRNKINKINKKKICIICTNEMDNGIVKLNCNHEMCPCCFARHSRENHTCPFCRKEFAPKIKKKEKMPIDVAESLIKRNVSYYFSEEMNEELCDNINKLTSEENTTHIKNFKASIYEHLNEIAYIMYEDIEEWHDFN